MNAPTNTTETTTETITCECGVKFEWHDQIPFLRSVIRPSHCPSCAEKIIDEEERQEAERLRKLAAEKLEAAKVTTAAEVAAQTPPRYGKTSISHPAFNAELWQKIKGWSPSDQIPFLGLIGESGACKTRIAYLLFREIIVGRIRPLPSGGRFHVPKFAALTSPEFAQAVGRQFIPNSGNREEDPRHEARRFLDRLTTCEVLLLDDLGKAKNTPSVAAELFAIIDHRHAQNLPTIWTANSTPEEVVRGMDADLAGPLAGRLIECSNIIRA